jgi:CheY-like chemotaxis protein
MQAKKPDTFKQSTEEIRRSLARDFMQAKKPDTFKQSTEEIRRGVHDVAAAIISVRALAETLAEHLPTLVAISRSRHPAKQMHISPATLDSLPAIPAEIVDLCEFAQGALKVVGNQSGTTEGADATSTRGRPGSATTHQNTRYEQIDRANVRVLLVEDEETARYVISQTLVAHGCGVVAATNGEEALGLFGTMDFDLVLMDLRLPGLSGCETTERLRAIESMKGRSTPIVGLTASPLLEEQMCAKAAGMDEVLIKPIDESELQSIFNRIP